MNEFNIGEVYSIEEAYYRPTYYIVEKIQSRRIYYKILYGPRKKLSPGFDSFEIGSNIANWSKKLDFNGKITKILYGG